MPKKRYEIAPGHELRGFRVRLYPDAGTEQWLLAQQQNMRTAWNWLVKQGADRDAAVTAYAIRSGLVPPKPTSPCYDGLSPDDAKERKAQHRNAVGEWYGLLRTKTKGDPCCEYRKFKDWLAHMDCKHDYQLLGKVLKWSHQDRDTPPIAVPGAHMLQALTKNFFQKSARPKRFKKRWDEMPVQVRSGECFRLGEYGSRGKNPSFYNCQISICGVKIKGRLPGATPAGRVLEGVSLVREADGWYASIKVETPIRKLPDTIPGSVIGIDVGLDNIAAMSDGSLIANQRDRYFSDRIAKLQTAADTTDDDLYAASLRKQSTRLHQRARRHSRHVIYNDVIKPLAGIETIKVENLTSKIGQMGSRKLSVMRLIYRLLAERYGDRVREVDCAYTSQDCSQCGFRSKESWSYDNGPFGTCPQCGYSEHRDINAARNIAARTPINGVQADICNVAKPPVLLKASTNGVQADICNRPQGARAVVFTAISINGMQSEICNHQ